MLPRRIRPVALILVLAAGAALGACGSSGSKRADTSVTQPPLSSTQATTPTTTVATTPTTTTPTTVTTTATGTTPTTATKPATTPTTSQSPGGAPAGCPSAVGGFVRNVQASGTDCGRASTVASAWFAAVHGGAAPDSQIAAAGYSCSGTLSGERASVSCSGAGGSSVSFTASP